MTEFNLSDKILDNQPRIYISDVKEFIKRLKDRINGCFIMPSHFQTALFEEIDKLAGEKLI